ncbi:MAG TPA: proline/glycine betaine ABC transporter permease [Desulfotomaculum sp.]|nr:MAG: choline ABC transporter permease [Peptococcaceae bacterium BRH_c8a]KJS72765.1 MAG: choline ABC transporter permease [Desulfotomaculum sp. BICA1-6]HBX23141.1 proline/glycine betaine ABC transporter permease [Desulfotomaculum sp.]
MDSFPASIRFELGVYVDIFVKWLYTNFGDFFDAVSSVVLWLMVNIENILLWLPWWSVLIIVLLLGWRFVSPIAGAIFALMLVLVGSFGYWDHMLYTLAIVMASVVISLVIGIPIGILMAYSTHAQSVMRPILDFMQTMPSLVYLIPAILFFGLGKVPGVFATTIYAIPPVIRLTDMGIRQVSKEMVEAAVSFGSSSWDILTKVQLPQALPAIMAGINQTTMMAISMVVIASMIGVKGLGMEVLIGIQRIDVGRGFEAGLGIVIIAIIMDRISQGVANRFKIPS